MPLYFSKPQISDYDISGLYDHAHIMKLCTYLFDFSYFEYHIRMIQNGVGVLNEVKGILHEASRQPTMGPRGRPQ